MASLLPVKQKTLAEKIKLIDKVADKVNKKYGKAIMGRIGANPEIEGRLKVEFIPTACPDVNLAVGGGFPRRRCTIIAGLEDSGKTSFVLETIGKVMHENAEFTAMWVESENSLDKEYICETFHIDPERFAFMPVDSGIQAEQILDILYEALKTGSIDLCCINSLKALVPTQEMDASMENAVVGTQARMNSRLSRKFNAVVAECNTAFIIITHLTTEIGSAKRDPLVVAGGHAIQYWSSLTMDFRKRSIGPGEPITKEEGVKIGVTVRKNHVMPDKFPYVKVEYYAIFGQGIETVLPLLNAACEKGICEARGAWIRWYNADGTEREKWNGKLAFRNYMLDHPEVFKELSNLVYEGGTNIECLSEEEVAQLKAEDAEMAEIIEVEARTEGRGSEEMDDASKEEAG